MIYNDQYPSRHETKKAHRAADIIGLDYDSHTLKPLIVEFLRDKKSVAKYDVITGEIITEVSNGKKT